ncbi:hypothetical protein EAS64_02535 [Trebonia kvetii]|uniref:Uncharacterized protein n=1 Tax=Trebonia kvetii TaxID=2480626 RepID=A0A6P2C7L4_9ACTN|nr:hypothetical protein [Trebonia kvetii]TVZ06326.1 hypothetical protein EAS64_02535 [Trebonia kvetii]
MSVSSPRLPRRMPPNGTGTRIIVLVIILGFVITMAVLGFAPAVALGVAAGAVAIAWNPRAARAVLEAGA